MGVEQLMLVCIKARFEAHVMLLLLENHRSGVGQWIQATCLSCKVAKPETKKIRDSHNIIPNSLM